MAFRRNGHLEGFMKTERNQLASVGRHGIWSLSDALPEKEAFQFARIQRDGLEPILAEETPSFLFTLDLHMCRDESFTARVYAGRKNLHQ